MLWTRRKKLLSFYLFRIAPNSRIALSTSSSVRLLDFLKYWNSSLFSSSALFAASVCVLISFFNISSSLLCWSFFYSDSTSFFETGFFFSLKNSRSARLMSWSSVETSSSSSPLVLLQFFPGSQLVLFLFSAGPHFYLVSASGANLHLFPFHQYYLPIC